MTYVDLRPDRVREVLVLVDGTWHVGDLEAYRHDGHTGNSGHDGRGWSGFVRWSVGPGLTHLGWHPEERLRPVHPDLLSPPPEPAADGSSGGGRG